MQIHSADFVTSARHFPDCPPWEYPEFAFIGRSNVGKSSLVNLLTNRNGLAKVSATPGKTRLVNFFLVNQSWCLVDLPGYGFAKTTRHDKFLFNELVGDYLEGRPNLRQVFVLIDSRLPPQQIDLDFLGWLHGTAKPFSLVFTKTDKQSPSRTRLRIEEFQVLLDSILGIRPPSLSSSAKTRNGRPEILRAIDALI